MHIHILSSAAHFDVPFMILLNKITSTYYLRSLTTHPSSLDSTRVRRCFPCQLGNFNFLGQCDVRESLQQSYNSIWNFHKSEILTQAVPWSTAEWKICPANLRKFVSFPSFRSKLFCIGTINVPFARRDILWNHHNFSFANQDWIMALWTAVSWQKVVCFASRMFSGTGGYNRRPRLRRDSQWMSTSLCIWRPTLFDHAC